MSATARLAQLSTFEPGLLPPAREWVGKRTGTASSSAKAPRVVPAVRLTPYR